VDLIGYLRRGLVERASRHGLLLTPEALEYVLFHVDDPDGLFSSLKKSGHTLVRLEDIIGGREERVERRVVREEVREVGCRPSVRVKLLVEDEESASWERERERILRERLRVLGEMIRLREGSVPYERALRSQEERVVVGVVLEKGKNYVYLENGQETATIYINSQKLDYVDRDAVVGIRARGDGQRLYGSDVVFPGPGNVGRSSCPFRLLVVPPGTKPPEADVHGIVFFGPFVDVIREPNPKEKYREWDKIFTSYDIPVFVVPGPQDAVKYTPPRPPLDENLLPDSAAADNVFLLSSPSLVRINGADVLFYDGEYYKKRGLHPLSALLTLLVQQNISTFPYISPKDYSLLKRAPTYFLLPYNASGEAGGRVVGSSRPFVLELSSGKVVGW